MKYLKKAILALVTIFSALFTHAQATEGSVMIDKENRHAVVITIDQPEKTTSEALQQRMLRSGLKAKTRNGATAYKGVTLSEISPDKVDIYTKVEKGPNNGSLVYMSVSRGYNNFTNSATDSSITQHVKDFLQAFVKDANYYSADLGIADQLSDVNKNEKAYQKLLDEQRDLQKKKLTIENRLAAIADELMAKQVLIDKKKSGVEDSKIKRSNIENQ